MRTEVLDPNNPGNDSKVDWNSVLNFGIIITDYEVNIIDFEVSFFKVGCMKNVPFMKTNTLTAEWRL